MIIYRDGNVYQIKRGVIRDDTYDWNDVNSVIIEKYDSIDIANFECRIYVNSNLSYKLSLKDSKEFLDKILKSEFRDQKINQILYDK